MTTLHASDYPAGTRIAHAPGDRIYVVRADGSVRRMLPKPRGKAERKAWKRGRQAARRLVCEHKR